LIVGSFAGTTDNVPVTAATHGAGRTQSCTPAFVRAGTSAVVLFNREEPGLDMGSYRMYNRHKSRMAVTTAAIVILD